MNWNIYSTVDALLTVSLTDHDMCTQLSVCTYCFAFYFFSPNTHFHTSTKSTHLCFEALWRILLVASEALNALASYFPASFYFIFTRLLYPSHSLAPTLPSPPSFRATHGVHVHPRCLVRLHCHPPLLTIILLALCSEHILSVTPLYEEDAIPIYQMRTLRLGNIL